MNTSAVRSTRREIYNKGSVQDVSSALVIGYNISISLPFCFRCFAIPHLPTYSVVKIASTEMGNRNIHFSENTFC